jgi:hypothetical protein
MWLATPSSSRQQCVVSDGDGWSAANVHHTHNWDYQVQYHVSMYVEEGTIVPVVCLLSRYSCQALVA